MTDQAMTTSAPDEPKTTRKYRSRQLPFIFYIPGMLWRHKALTIAVLGGLYAADRVYGPDVVARFEGKPLVTVEAKICQTETCTATARSIASATAYWIESVKGRQGYNVPDYMNARFAIGSAGIESDMGANLQSKGSRYEGLFQLSRQIDRTHFTHIAGELFETLKAIHARDPIGMMIAIPALNEIMITDKQNPRGRKITPLELQQMFAEPVVYQTKRIAGHREPLRYATNRFIELLRADKALFRDNTIQTLAFLEASHKLHKGYGSDAQFQSLAETEKHAIMYGFHNLPRITRNILRNHSCELPVSIVSPRDADYFAGNSGLYEATGRATPAQVRYRISYRQWLYTNSHGLRSGVKGLETSVRPTEPQLHAYKGIFHRLVVRSILNSRTCKV